MPGRRPIPTEIKKLNGNPGKRPLNQAEPQPKTGEPTQPQGLSTAARKEWRRVVPILLKMGVLTEVDGPALAAYCEAWASWTAALKDIRKNGLSYVAPTGVKHLNPVIPERDKAIQVMKTFLVEFGMTPASRSRIHVTPPPKEEDPFEQLISGKGQSGTAARLN